MKIPIVPTFSLLLLIFAVFPLVSSAQENSSRAYRNLKEYEGSYEYFGGMRIELAASPRDNRLYAIINEILYPLEQVAKDTFLDVQKTKVLFERDSANQITGYKIENNFFRRRSIEHFPVTMWYSRYVKGAKKYQFTYSIPKRLNDDLPVGSLSKTQLDRNAIKEMVERVSDETYKNIHSILIIKDGKLVLEEYFYDYDRNRLHQLRSATKSVVSALVGIAIQRGFVKSKRETVLSFFPEYDLKNVSEDKKKITIENLLTNQSGLACDDDDKNSPGNEVKMGRSSDWVKFILDLPMIDRPGNGARYCSGGAIVLGKIVEKATGKLLKNFAAERLFRPLGISEFSWNFRPDSSSEETFCQIYLTPRAMAKFGLLYLNGGRFNGKQVIDEEWVTNSLAKQTVLNNTEYGYLWWRPWLNVGGKRIEGSAAKGNGGQRIFLWNDFNMVAVVTGGNYGGNSPSDELLGRYLLPALSTKAKSSRD